jgi:hypothetical protein
MDPLNTTTTDPLAAGQPTSEPAYDPSQVSIVSAAEPRYGLEPQPMQYGASEESKTATPVSQRASLPPVPPAAAAVAPVASTRTTVVTSPDQSAQGKTQAGSTAKPKTNPNSTQNTLHVAEVRDGIVIMNDGSYRSVVMMKSINFDLMSPQEQEAVEYSYQGFLNSLYFPIQIFIRSRKVDLRPYLERMDKIRSEHDNMLLAILMEDYIAYMSDLSQQTNIMDKNFYVIIPFFPVVEVQKALTQNKNFLTNVAKLFGHNDQHVVINEGDLEDAKNELRNRVQAVLAGLQQCGVQGLPLDTQELIELYYDSYNPDTATRQKLKEMDSLTADIVKKGQGVALQPHLQRELQ